MKRFAGFVEDTFVGVALRSGSAYAGIFDTPHEAREAAQGHCTTMGDRPIVLDLMDGTVYTWAEDRRP